MRSETLVGMGLAAGVVALLGALVYRSVATFRVRWLSLADSIFTAAKYAGYMHHPPPPAEDVRRALLRAYRAIAAHGPWDDVRVLEALQDVRIRVWPSPTFRNVALVEVHGQQSGQYVDVGSDLLALAHELVHVCEERLDGKADKSHAAWVARGLRAAEAEYETGITRL